MIYLAADHAGFELKERLKAYLEELGYQAKDFGAYSYNSSDDYPDFVIPAARAVASDPEGRGIIIGFNGQGEAMAANRIRGVRAVVYYGEPRAISEAGKKRQDKPKDIIVLSRRDDNANVLSLAAGFVPEWEAKMAVKKWLETPFLGEERHVRRLRKIVEIEERNFR